MALFNTSTAGSFDSRDFDLHALAQAQFPANLDLYINFNGQLFGIFGQDRLDVTPLGQPASTITLLGAGFARDATTMTGGTLSAIFLTPQSGANRAVRISDISVDVTDLFAAAATATLNDDRALLAAMMSSDDRFILGSRTDFVSGAAGHDWLAGGGGADWLQGDSGNDTLLGAGGKDTIIGGNGTDVLVGGRSADTFIFDATDGFMDHVRDFDPSQDHVLLQTSRSTTSYSVIGGSGGVAELHFGQTVIIFDGLTPADTMADGLIQFI